MRQSVARCPELLALHFCFEELHTSLRKIITKRYVFGTDRLKRFSRGTLVGFCDSLRFLALKSVPCCEEGFVASISVRGAFCFVVNRLGKCERDIDLFLDVVHLTKRPAAVGCSTSLFRDVVPRSSGISTLDGLI